MVMARSHLGRRPRPGASVAGEEAYSRTRRRRRQWRPPSPTTPVQQSPSYSPTSPIYSPTSPSFYHSPSSPSLPASTAVAEAYYPRLPRLDDDDGEDVIGDEGPGPEGQQDDVYHIHEEEEEHERSENESYNFYYGSGAIYVYGAEIQQQHDEDDEIGEVSVRSDGENGVEDEQGEEAPAPLPHDDVQGNVAAAGESDDDGRPISVVSAPAPAAPQEPSPPAPSFPDYSSSVIQNVTVENTSALDCSICYLPLKSPIFQCSVGHVVCSACHDKLGQATNCHVCRIPLPGGYLRCNAMEQVVDAIRVPCPHAAHGCAERLAYHGRDDHARTCVHKPCYCPGEGCGFAGLVQSTLLEHFAAVHGWPCNTGTPGLFDVRLRKGINIVVVRATADSAADDQGTMTMASTEQQQYTLVLNVEQTAPVCNTVTAFCIHPSNTGTVRLGLSYYRRWRRQDSVLPATYLQSSQLQVVCTDLSHGMPGPSSCFPFLVPRWSASSPGGDHGDDDIRISVNYISGT